MKMYSNGYVVSIVVNGMVVDERADSVVPVPFGCDYVIRLTNRNDRRALACVFIDGQAVTGGGIIVDAYNTVNLERPTDKPVTFRFASTESVAAEEHGKAGPDVHGDKGLIKVEWLPEKKEHLFVKKYMAPSPYVPGRLSSLRRGGESTLRSYDAGSEAMGFSDKLEKTSSLFAPSNLQSGVTVEGGHSSQSFRRVHFEPDYSKAPTVIILKLKGFAEEEGIPREGTRFCPECRTRTKKDTDRYCRHCGTPL